MKKKLVLLGFIAIATAILYGHHTGEAASGGDCTGASGPSGCGPGCHSSATTNSTVVELDSAGVPVTSYVPGGSYTVKISASNGSTTSLPKFGFQLTVVKLAGAGTSPVDAGTWGTLPTNVRKTTPAQSGLPETIIEQSTQITATTGTGGNGTTYVESIPWTAPATGTGPVVIYGILNEVNNNGQNSGDKYQVATAKTITEAAPRASVSISITSGSNPTCANSSLTFTATPTNGGSAPTYIWFVDGGQVATGNPFSILTLTNGQVVTCQMASNLSGVTGSPATSTGTTVTVNPLVIPTISITPSATTICAGTNVSFTSSNTNTGASPTYQWKKNGTNISGQTSSTYSSTTLANGDIISLAMTSNAACASPATVTSQNDTITVNPVLVPTVSITPSATTICAGSNISFTSSITNGGTSPGYQWKKNGNNIGGQTSSTFSSTMLANGDVISLALTSNATCANPSTVTSRADTITVNTMVTPTVSITPSATTICAGSSVSFTSSISNGGAGPTYQWKKNGSNINGQTGASYSSNALANGDVISLALTSNANCLTSSTANSQNDTIIVNPLLVPTVSISPSTNTLCAGANVSFTSSITNGGASPAYQWRKNGSNINGQTGSSFSSTTLANGDVISLALTSNATCASPATVFSGSDTMVVNPVLVPSVTIASNSGNNICAGQTVTFSATPVNGGTPVYQWMVNNHDINGANGPSYNTDSLFNGDLVAVKVISNALCAAPTQVKSDSIAITIVANATPTVSIAADAVDSICNGQLVTFTANAVNGGNAPAFQWFSNGDTIQGANLSTYSTNGLTASEAISVAIISNSQCVVTNNASSNTISFMVNPTTTPMVGITNPGSDTLCTGGVFHFIATPFNGGSNPTYQWKKNGNDLIGETADNFSSALNDGDVISVVMTSNATCASPQSVPSVDYAVGVFAQANVIVTRSTDTLFATNAVSYQWSFNNSVINGETGQFTLPHITGDYTVSITDANGCTATSAPFNFIVTGVSETDLSGIIALYPNPAQGTLFVDYKGANSLSIKMVDVNGLAVMQKWSSSEEKLALDVSALPDGLYILQMNMGGMQLYRKVVIANRLNYLALKNTHPFLR